MTQLYNVGDLVKFVPNNMHGDMYVEGTNMNGALMRVESTRNSRLTASGAHPQWLEVSLVNEDKFMEVVDFPFEFGIRMYSGSWFELEKAK